MIWKTANPFLVFSLFKVIQLVRPLLRVPLRLFPLFIVGIGLTLTGTLYAQGGELSLNCPPPDTNGDEGTTLPVFSTGPFNCTATLIPDAPTVTTECPEWDWTFEVFRELIDPATGELELELVAVAQNQVATGIAPGTYVLRYLVVDNCGGRGEQDCEILVIDERAPNAICPNLKTITLTEKDTDNQGRYLLTALNFSGQSFDNCSDGLQREIRRTLSADCRAGYVQQVYGLTWPDDFSEQPDASEEISYFVAGTDTLLVSEQGQFFTWWADKTYVNCCDGGEELFVDLRLTDLAGNQSSCRGQVAVMDQLPPIAEVADITLPCTALSFDPSDPEQVAAALGAASEVLKLSEPCLADLSEVITWTPGDCGGGLLHRDFTLTDQNGLVTSIRQTIQVQPVTHYEIEFPGDDSERTCGISTGVETQLADFGCNLLSTVVDTIPLEVSGGACERYSLQYRVINWCEYGGDEAINPVVVGRDLDQDADYTEPTWVEVDDQDAEGMAVRFYTLDDQGNRQLSRALTAAEYATFTPGIFEYAQVIKVFDNEAPQTILVNSKLDFCALNLENCSGSFTILLTTSDDCSPDEVALINMELLLDRDPNQGIGENEGVFTLERSGMDAIITGELPIGTHRLLWEAVDACGNVKYEALDLAIVDCKRPLPICKGSMGIDLQPVDLDGDGQADQAKNTLFAADLVLLDPEDCSGPVTYSINRSGAQPDRTQQSLTVDCNDLSSMVIQVEIHAWDAAGNYGTCETIIVVRDENDLCSSLLGDGAIKGAIATETGIAMNGVEVHLSGRGAQVLMTNNEGGFNFSGLEESYDYTIQPWLDKDYLNGVSTFDLVLISKHILQLEALTSPYHIIAADVNNSKTITTLDLVQLRKIVLNVETKFRNNTSWRFVDASYTFPNPANPWQEIFPEVVNINNLSGDNIEINFIAIKVGDVSGNAFAQLSGAPQPRGGGEPAQLQLQEKDLEPGNVYQIPVFAPGSERLQGMQFTLELDPTKTELLGIVPGILQEADVGIFRPEGQVSASWNKLETASDCDEPIREAGDACPLFYLSIRASQQVNLGDVLRLTSNPTPAEAYDEQGQVVDLTLFVTPSLVATSIYSLKQNFPNPFRHQTMIGFTLAQSGPATLTVWDTQGRLLYTLSRDFTAGYHELPLDKTQLNGLQQGILIYRLQAADWRASRRMLLVTN